MVSYQGSEPFFRRLQLVSAMDQSPDLSVYRDQAYRRKLAELQAANPMPNPGPASVNLGSVTGGSPVGGSEFERFIRAIGAKESSGRYGLVNPDSGAAGKYQLMPANVREWSREVLGRSISMQEYLRNPQIQEQIARAKLQQYYNKYGAKGAAAAWYGGPGAVKKMNSTKRYGGGKYPSILEYINDVLKRMG